MRIWASVAAALPPVISVVVTIRCLIRPIRFIGVLFQMFSSEPFPHFSEPFPRPTEPFSPKLTGYPSPFGRLMHFIGNISDAARPANGKHDVPFSNQCTFVCAAELGSTLTHYLSTYNHLIAQRALEASIANSGTSNMAR